MTRWRDVAAREGRRGEGGRGCPSGGRAAQAAPTRKPRTPSSRVPRVAEDGAVLPHHPHANLVGRALDAQRDAHRGGVSTRAAAVPCCCCCCCWVLRVMQRQPCVSTSDGGQRGSGRWRAGSGMAPLHARPPIVLPSPPQCHPKGTQKVFRHVHPNQSTSQSARGCAGGWGAVLHPARACIAGNAPPAVALCGACISVLLLAQMHWHGSRQGGKRCARPTAHRQLAPAHRPSVQNCVPLPPARSLPREPLAPSGCPRRA